MNGMNIYRYEQETETNMWIAIVYAYRIQECVDRAVRPEQPHEGVCLSRSPMNTVSNHSRL